MKYEPKLQRASLLRRYKRFLADVELDDGKQVTIHCPNTGSMRHCATPGDEVWFSTSANLKRKYSRTWELSRDCRRHYIGVNTTKANAIVREALLEHEVPELDGYADLRGEVRYGLENSRVDLLLHDEVLGQCFVEVKSVTLLETPFSAGQGYFPDAVSDRGARHLRELMAMVESGARAVLFFLVQHSGIRVVRPAVHIDPAYSEQLQRAVAAGVEVLAYKCRMSPGSNRIFRRVDFELD